MSKEKPGWSKLSRGAVSSKSSRDYETGDWGVEKPEIDRDKCTKCMLCHFYCPEGAITVREDGYTEVETEHCKGCGICSEECPAKCIRMVRKG